MVRDPGLARLGGPEKLRKIVDRLHAEIEEDPELKSLFDRLAPTTERRNLIRSHTVDLLCMVLAGEEYQYTGQSMVDAHRSFREAVPSPMMRAGLYDRVCQYFWDSTRDAGIPEDLFKHLQEVVRGLAPQVIYGER